MACGGRGRPGLGRSMVMVGSVRDVMEDGARVDDVLSSGVLTRSGHWRHGGTARAGWLMDKEENDNASEEHR